MLEGREAETPTLQAESYKLKKILGEIPITQKIQSITIKEFPINDDKNLLFIVYGTLGHTDGSPSEILSTLMKIIPKKCEECDVSIKILPTEIPSEFPPHPRARLLSTGDSPISPSSSQCNTYSDCFNCTFTYDCIWSSILSTPCFRSTASTSVYTPRTADNWWLSVYYCQTDTNYQCPSYKSYYLSAGDYISVKLPRFSIKSDPMYKGGFCSWKYYNYDHTNVKVTIQDMSTTKIALSVGVGSSSSATYTYLDTPQSFSTTAEQIAFYFYATDTLSSTGLSLTISSEQVSTLEFSYVAIILMVLIGLIFLYALLACIRYCLQRRHNHAIATGFQSPEWINGAPRRLEKIFSESPEAEYEPSYNKYAQAHCAICLCDFQPKMSIRKLHCDHIFHKDCIEGWIKAKINVIPKCPMCNVDLCSDRPPAFSDPQNNRGPNNGVNVPHPENRNNAAAVPLAAVARANGVEPLPSNRPSGNQLDASHRRNNEGSSQQLVPGAAS